MAAAAMDEALSNLRVHIATCEQLENNLRGKATGGLAGGKPRSGSKAARKERAGGGSLGAGGSGRAVAAGHVGTKSVAEILRECMDVCKQSRKRHREENERPILLGGDSLSQFTRFTDQIAMDPYVQFLHYVPRLVNVVRVVLPVLHPPILTFSL